MSQFWAFANDLYTEGQGRRLFPMIGVGQSLGAWVGAVTVGPLVIGLNYTPYTLMVLGAVVLIVALAITLVVNRRETARAEPQAIDADRTPLGPQGGFELVLEGSLPLLDCHPHRPAERGQHHRRLRAQPADRRGSGGPIRHGAGRSGRQPAVRDRVFRRRSSPP